MLQGLRDVRADVINRKDEFQKDFELLGNYTSDVASCRLQEAEKQFAAESKEKDDLIAVSCYFLIIKGSYF